MRMCCDTFRRHPFGPSAEVAFDAQCPVGVHHRAGAPAVCEHRPCPRDLYLLRASLREVVDALRGHLRSCKADVTVQGNCDNPDAAASLRLDAGLAADLLPMKPRQCLLVMNQTWLMVNAGNILVDNLYLKLSRTLYMPTFVFITQGALFGEEEWFNIKSSSVYVINVTFHAEDRGCAAAVSSHQTFNAVYLDGAASPLAASVAAVCWILIAPMPRACIYRCLSARLISGGPPGPSVERYAARDLS